MELMENANPADFLAPCASIDFDHPEVNETAISLRRATPTQTAQACFEFVRDQILHSSDHQLDPVTCRASAVLRHQTGFCYAKSHLLAALLRANQIPAGLCYQRLTIADDQPQFCLHGLNAIHLPEFGWYRVDPRGNRPGVNSQFSPPVEKLAFAVVHPGEQDLPTIYARPLQRVVTCLNKYRDWQEVCDNLPDLDATL